jgi:hypothetical protein
MDGGAQRGGHPEDQRQAGCEHGETHGNPVHEDAAIVLAGGAVNRGIRVPYTTPLGYSR